MLASVVQLAVYKDFDVPTRDSVVLDPDVRNATADLVSGVFGNTATLPLSDVSLPYAKPNFVRFAVTPEATADSVAYPGVITTTVFPFQGVKFPDLSGPAMVTVTVAVDVDSTADFNPNYVPTLQVWDDGNLLAPDVVMPATASSGVTLGYTYVYGVPGNYKPKMEARVNGIRLFPPGPLNVRGLEVYFHVVMELVQLRASYRPVVV